MFRNIVSGLNMLHQKNIIHRDLKSANIFISKGMYKIADLNVSKLLRHTVLAYTQTGTPYYASPEVWQDKPYELKSDIWSLGIFKFIVIGCIIYEACALRPPFTGNSMEGLYKKVFLYLRFLIYKVMKGIYPKLPSNYS
jgi:NIMA (never in mitosis gene a)-related kinase